jgi:hypothetical protein
VLPALAAFTAALALALAGPAQAATARHRPAAAACAVRGSTTVALDPQARVYARSQRGDADQHELFGCLLRTRRTLRRASTGSSVAALVLGPRGAFAYVSGGGAVVKSDASGEGVVLDPGPGIDPASLAIGGTWVFWMHGTVPIASRLAP